jgi:hypothetical protein
VTPAHWTHVGGVELRVTEDGVLLRRERQPWMSQPGVPETGWDIVSHREWGWLVADVRAGRVNIPRVDTPIRFLDSTLFTGSEWWSLLDLLARYELTDLLKMAKAPRDVVEMARATIPPAGAEPPKI